LSIDLATIKNVNSLPFKEYKHGESNGNLRCQDGHAGPCGSKDVNQWNGKDNIKNACQNQNPTKLHVKTEWNHGLDSEYIAERYHEGEEGNPTQDRRTPDGSMPESKCSNLPRKNKHKGRGQKSNCSYPFQHFAGKPQCPLSGL